MSSDPGLPVPIISIAFSILQSSFLIFKELSENDVISYRSATIDWATNTIEQEWQLQNKLGSTRLKQLLNKITRARQLTIPSVISVEGMIVPSSGNDLFQLGILSKTNSQLRINLNKLSEFNSGEIIIIRFTVPFNKSLYGNLCQVFFNKHPNRVNKNFEFSFSVVLNRADLWNKTFHYYEVKNILVPFDIFIAPNLIEKSLPQDLKQKLLSYGNAALRSRQDALEYCDRFNRDLLPFLHNRLNSQLGSIMHINSSVGSTSIGTAEFGIAQYQIGDGYGINFPNRYHVNIICSLNGVDHALKGTIVFDSEALETFISDTTVEFDKNIEASR